MDEKKYYPLTREQQALVDLFGYYPDQQILNICVRIRFEEPIDEQVMVKAFDMLPQLLPYCRLRVHQQDDGSTVQYLYEGEAEPVEVLDCSELTEEEIDALFKKWAYELFPNDCRDVQLYKAKLVKCPGGREELFFCAHHFVMDAYTVIHTMITMGEVYTAYLNGTELPKTCPEPWALVEQESKYYSSERFERDKAWWAEEYREEPHFTSLNGLGSPEFIEGKNYGLGQDLTQLGGECITHKIPKALVDEINQAALEKNISPQLYYLLALRTYLGHVSGTEDVIVDTAVARRASLIQKRSGLSRANALPFRSVISEKASFEEALNMLDAKQKEIYRHPDVLLTDFFEIIDGQHEHPLGNTYHTTWLTYQPYFDTKRIDLKLSANTLETGVAAAPLYVYITPQDGSGELYAYYGIAVGYTKKESVEKFHAFMLKFLEKGIAAPDKSLEQLISESM